MAVDTTNWDDWDLDDFKAELIGDLDTIKGGYEVDKWLDRDMHAIYAYDVAKYSKEYGTLIYKTVYVTIASGYYSGISLDYIVEDGGEVYDFKGTKGLDKEVEKLTGKITKVLKRHGTELAVTARFSNGETWYSKV